MPTMWDKIRVTAPPKQRGGPFDDPRDTAGNGVGGQLNNGYSYYIKGGPAPPRPPREFHDAKFETARIVHYPPPRAHQRESSRNSFLRPASSVYSDQPSPRDSYQAVNVAAIRAPQYGYGGASAADEVSPPSSPEPEYVVRQPQGHTGRPSSPDVSPIEEDADTARQLGPSRHGGVSNHENSGEPQQRANIPQMRRARRKQSDAAMRDAHARDRGSPQPEPKNPVLWDPMTGERTSTGTGTGRPSQVKPAEYARGLGISDATTLPSQLKSPTVPISVGERFRRLAQAARPDRPAVNTTTDYRSVDPAAAAFASNRPGWRGASGRTALVDPVRDSHTVAPLKVPPRSEKRLISPTSSGPAPGPAASGARHSLGFFKKAGASPVSPRFSETQHGTAPHSATPAPVPSPQSPPIATQTFDVAQNYPSPNDAPAVAAKQLQAYGNDLRDDLVASSPTGSDFSNRYQPHEKVPIRRKPPPSSQINKEQANPGLASQSRPPPQDLNPATHLGPQDPWVQPGSRFSTTTYATSAAATPRESLDTFNQNQPPVPQTPEQSQQASSQDATMWKRKQPATGLGSNTFDASPAGASAVMSKKEAHAQNQGNRLSQAARDRRPPGPFTSHIDVALRDRTNDDRRASVASSINKSLPTPPPESTASAARDRIGVFNAQLQALGNRRINLMRSIKQMTELMPTDNLMASNEVIAKREMEKRKVEAFREELADVQREEYELGLKLHRAYKRLDRDAEFEPTTLWVRRITS